MRLLLEDCTLLSGGGNILIEDGKIIYVGKDTPPSDRRVPMRGNWVIPGIIDPHEHLRDLEQADKEDWTSGSQAAFSGGITTVFEMPNTIPPTTNIHNLNLKRTAAGRSLLNHKFFLGVTHDNLSELEFILRQDADDIVGIKIFLADSGSLSAIRDKKIIRQLFSLARKYNTVVAVHTELQDCLENWQRKTSGNKIAFHNEIRNRRCAIQGTELVLKIAREIKNKLYLAHVSTREEVELVRSYKDDNTIYCEVTPHHLLLNETVLDRVGNFGKVNPPLRTAADNAALWQAVRDGTIDLIGTDHAPHTRAEKQKPYPAAPSGFPGSETLLPLLLTAVNKEYLTMNRLTELTAGRAAEIFDLPDRGVIKAGSRADLVVVDKNKKWTIDAAKFHSKAKYSPFDGMEVEGAVLMTLIDGSIVLP